MKVSSTRCKCPFQYKSERNFTSGFPQACWTWSCQSVSTLLWENLSAIEEMSMVASAHADQKGRWFLVINCYKPAAWQSQKFEGWKWKGQVEIQWPYLGLPTKKTHCHLQLSKPCHVVPLGKVLLDFPKDVAASLIASPLVSRNLGNSKYFTG